MARNYQINDAARSLDFQQYLDWLRGWQVVDPGGGSNAVSEGTGDFEYDIDSGDINAGGTIVTCSAGSVDFASDIGSGDDDKMAVIYRDASGNAQKEVGSPNAQDPDGADPRNTHTPPPPTLHNTNGVVLAEVLLPAGASSIGSDEFRDRRDPAAFAMGSLSVHGQFTTHAEKVSEATTTSGQRRIFADTSVSGFPLTLSDADTVLGNEIALRVIGDGDLTIETESAQTVDGGSSITITATDGEVAVSSDGDDWFSDRFGDFSAITADQATINDFIGYPEVTKTISSGSIDASDATYISIDGEGNSADDLDQISGGSDGQIVVLRRGAHAITVRHAQGGTDPIILDGQTNKSLESQGDRLMLMYESGNARWAQIAFSNNG